jgi:P27 family predicted phage terminase small subunit
MRTGRPPKPTVLHKLHGTARPVRIRKRAAEPVPLADLGEPPPELTDSQQAVWSHAVRHMPAGVLKSVDRDVFLVWVEAVDRHRTAMLMQAVQDQRRKTKLLVKGEASPYLGIMDRTSKTIIRLAGELGFSPAARPRLRADPSPATAGEADRRADPWQALKVIKGGKASQ